MKLTQMYETKALKILWPKILSKCNLIPYTDPGMVIHTFNGARATNDNWRLDHWACQSHIYQCKIIDSPGFCGITSHSN